MIEIIKLFLIFLKFVGEARQKSDAKKLCQKELDDVYKEAFLKSLKKLRSPESTELADDKIDEELGT